MKKLRSLGLKRIDGKWIANFHFHDKQYVGFDGTWTVKHDTFEGMKKHLTGMPVYRYTSQADAET